MKMTIARLFERHVASTFSQYRGDLQFLEEILGAASKPTPERNSKVWINAPHANYHPNLPPPNKSAPNLLQSGSRDPRCVTALNKRPKRPVPAPLPNLPQPATAAAPPRVALAARAAWK